MKERLPRQCDLRSRDHDKFAAAMMLCRHAGAFCFTDGYCHYDGECFTRVIQPKRNEILEKINSLEKRIAQLEGRSK